MRSLLVVVAACSVPAATPQAPRVVEPTGPELVTSAPGATAFAIDGSDIYWIAPGSGVWELAGGSATKLAEVGSGVHGLIASQGSPEWLDRGHLAKPGSDIEIQTDPIGEIALWDAAWVVSRRDGDGWRAVKVPPCDQPCVWPTFPLDGEPVGLVVGSDDSPIIGTSTMLYQGSDATPIDGGVHALAVDGDDIFFGNTSIFEKYGHGPVNKLGPAGGPVTAMAVDPSYVYWAIGAGDRDPAIYRAKRAKPELELFTRVGSASQLIVAGEFLYWLDPAEGAIHRIRRQK